MAWHVLFSLPRDIVASYRSNSLLSFFVCRSSKQTRPIPYVHDCIYGNTVRRAFDRLSVRVSLVAITSSPNFSQGLVFHATSSPRSTITWNTCFSFCVVTKISCSCPFYALTKSATPPRHCVLVWDVFVGCCSAYTVYDVVVLFLGVAYLTWPWLDRVHIRWAGVGRFEFYVTSFRCGR